MAASQPAFEPPSSQDVSFRDLACQPHRVFEWEREQGDAKPNPLRALRGGSKKR
ncbi:MAG TPA: hypothetical protein VHF01_02045 [Candidatus Acidoferrum sp.]|nr:hypothetical protein [Candidatus Acidoferrum sp.]